MGGRDENDEGARLGRHRRGGTRRHCKKLLQSKASQVSRIASAPAMQLGELRRSQSLATAVRPDLVGELWPLSVRTASGSPVKSTVRPSSHVTYGPEMPYNISSTAPACAPEDRYQSLMDSLYRSAQ